MLRAFVARLLSQSTRSGEVLGFSVPVLGPCGVSQPLLGGTGWPATLLIGPGLSSKRKVGHVASSSNVEFGFTAFVQTEF